jgi:hypothetical protein
MKDYDRWLIAFADGHVKVYSSETDLPNGLHTPGSNPSIMQLWHGLLYGYGFEAKIPSPSLLARGAFAAQRLAVLLQQQNPGRYSAPELAAYLQNRETLQSLFNAIDADADAQLSLDELLSYDLGLAVVVFPPGGGGRPDVGSDGPGADGYPVEVLEFLGAAAGELQALINADLCAAGADSCVGNFGYEDFLAASGNGLFSLSTLRSLTKEFVTQAGVANSLCAKLDAAEAAGKRGQAKVKAQTLRAYLNQLRAQTGVTVAADRAGTLTFLVQGL